MAKSFPLLVVIAVFLGLAACDDAPAGDGEITTLEETTETSGGDSTEEDLEDELELDQQITDLDQSAPDQDPEFQEETTEDLADALAGLGESCASNAGCVSGFCMVTPSNATVCSTCAQDSDCIGTQSCTFNDGLGYWSCEEAALQPLGTSCGDNAECESGICAVGVIGSVCSICATNADCGTNQACVPGSGVNYLFCVGQQALGESCSSDAECVQQHCFGGVCGSCSADLDCGDGGACSLDNELGYAVCAGGLGDACAADGDCASGACYEEGAAMICSECNSNADCGVQRTCVYDDDLRYAVCLGTGTLGQACDDSNQCEPGSHCNGGLCSECESDSDCLDGGLCIYLDGIEYAVCSGGMGDICASGSDCNSGNCYSTDGYSVCSECDSISDCGPQQDCFYQGELGYAACVGTGSFGAACVDETQCIDEAFCFEGACSECREDADCDGGSCIFDTVSEYHTCLKANGESCSEGSECQTGICRVGTFGNGLCSDCIDDADCPAGSSCTYDFLGGMDYAMCLGSVELGNSCSADYDCASGICSNDVCAECATDADCGVEGSCVSGSSYDYCLSGYGETCSEASDCASGICTNLVIYNVCSECSSDADCPNGESCNIAFETPFYQYCG